MRLMHRISIRAQLTLAFGIGSTLVLLVGIFGLLQLYRVNQVASEIGEIWLPRMERIAELKATAEKHMQLTSRQLDTLDYHQLADIGTALDDTAEKIDAGVARLIDEVGGGDTDHPLHRFIGHWGAYLQSRHDTLAMLDVGDLAGAKRRHQSVTNISFRGAIEAIEELVRQHNAATLEARDRARSIFVQAVNLAFAVAAAAYAMVFFAGRWANRHISEPIRGAASSLRRLQAGDLQTVVFAAPRADEIGVLTDAVTGYRESLLKEQQLAEQAEIERQRLGAAVANMPMGLCMFDAQQRLIISNARFADLYGLDAASLRPGVGIEELEPATSGPQSAGPTRATVMTALAGMAQSDSRATELVELPGKLFVNVTHQPMPSGGWVAVHEDVTERHRAAAMIVHMARHDALTDLPNRTLLAERIEAALQRAGRGEPVAVMCLDLDRFKQVNDTFGHPIGDALLVEVARRLRTCIRPADTVARLGGDEFAVVQVGVKQPAGAQAVAERIIRCLSTPYSLEDQRVTIGASLGFAIAPADGMDPDQLMRCADRALYRAKKDGRGTYRAYESSMEAALLS